MSDEKIKLDKVNESGVIPTAAEIKALEDEIGYKIPQSYIDLLSDKERTFPTFNRFPTPPAGGEAISIFYSFEDAIEKYRINSLNYDLPPLFPIARTSDGYACLQLNNANQGYGSVHLLTTSFMVGETPEDVPLKLAATLEQFMQSIKHEPWQHGSGGIGPDHSGGSDEDIAKRWKAAKLLGTHKKD